jgi:hypothetical protein
MLVGQPSFVLAEVNTKNTGPSPQDPPKILAALAILAPLALSSSCY